MPSTCYEAILGATTVKQIISAGFDPQAQVKKLRANGAVGPSAIMMSSAVPLASLTTADLTTLIGMTGFFNTGANITSTGVTLPYIKRQDGGTFASGSSHHSISGASALVVPTSISVEHNSEAGGTVNLQVYFRSSNGRIIPFAINSGVALAASSFSQQYKMGPVLINGTQLAKCTGYTIETGIAVRPKSYNGNEYPTELLIEAEILDPIMTINFENMEALGTYGPLFASLSSAVCYARRLADGGTTVSDATASHAKFSFADGLAVNNGLSAEHQQDGNASIVLHGKGLTAALSTVVLE